jgi:FkbM family methyltransferase
LAPDKVALTLEDFSYKSVVLRHWWQGMSVMLPHSGSAAPLFYRNFSSPELVGFVTRFLRPGMTVLDIGAHVGEYTLIAAYLVGSHGKVHDVEPQPDLAEIIMKNVTVNRFPWVTVHPCAVADHIGKLLFTADPHSKGGWLAEKMAMQETFGVQTTTLDDFCRKQNLQHVDFIKLDAAGNELAAPKGGKHLLTSNYGPALVVKLYHPEVIRERFGYDGHEIVRLLLDWEYQLYELTLDGPQPFTGSVQGYCIPIFATRGGV